MTPTQHVQRRRWPAVTAQRPTPGEAGSHVGSSVSALPLRPQRRRTGDRPPAAHAHAPLL
eukprot:4056885-Pleurochrysis_carterae.AAC.1